MEHPEVAIFLVSDSFDPETLLRALRAGAQEVLKRPLDRSTLSAAVERVAQLNARKQGGVSARTVLTVFSPKGGAGATTLATNLAVCLRRATAREVALVDFDHQSGDAAFILGLSPVRSLADVLASPNLDSASVQDVLAKHESGLRVLAQPEQLDRVDPVSAPQTGAVLDILTHTFEIVVADVPHTLSDVTLEVLDRSSAILLVAEQTMPSVRAARRALEIFHRLNYLAMPERVRLIVNRSSEKEPVTLAQLQETLGMEAFARIASDHETVSRSVSLGRPLCDEAPDTRPARDIAALARSLVPVEAPNGDAEPVLVRRNGRRWPFGKGKTS
jgi:pilus assembly protein CpaE